MGTSDLPPTFPLSLPPFRPTVLPLFSLPPFNPAFFLPTTLLPPFNLLQLYPISFPLSTLPPFHFLYCLL